MLFPQYKESFVLFCFLISIWYSTTSCYHLYLYTATLIVLLILKTELQSIYKEIWESCFVGVVAISAFNSAYSLTLPFSYFYQYFLIVLWFITILDQK